MDLRPGASLPSGSLSEKLQAGAAYAGPEEIAADRWFEDWARGCELLEDALYIPSWDQTLALIWFEDEEVPSLPRTAREEQEELGLLELDGILPWPGKEKRR